MQLFSGMYIIYPLAIVFALFHVADSLTNGGYTSPCSRATGWSMGKYRAIPQCCAKCLPLPTLPLSRFKKMCQWGRIKLLAVDYCIDVIGFKVRDTNAALVTSPSAHLVMYVGTLFAYFCFWVEVFPALHSLHLAC